MTSPAPRKGARSRGDIPPQVLDALNAGRAESLTLAEGLAVDFAQLMTSACPRVDVTPLAQAADLGITRRMTLAAELALTDLGADGIGQLAAHPSDTVRGWAAFMIGLVPELDLARRLELIRPLADDAHFGVREWAWLGIRAHVAADADRALALLAPWCGEASPFLRRFASESTRPRGVWCAHITSLRADPRPGLQVLDPLCADADRYVGNSVANWLNDAAKDHPHWVEDTCRRWENAFPGPATRAITKRARRSLIPNPGE